MLPDEVREAVERNWSNARVNAGLVRAMAQLDPRASNLNHIADDLIGLCDDIDTLRAHLLAREAEVTELRREMDDYNAVESALEDAIATNNKHVSRAERAEALLRECRQMLPDYCTALTNRITAHLSENSRG